VVGAVFSAEAIRQMFTDEVRPFFPQGQPEADPAEDTADGPDPSFAVGEW
jgi:hypothetical protein